jgi:hypothetical protein
VADYIANLLTDFNSATTFVALLATALGAVSLFLSNIARYTQAQKYGIPIKAMHQANIADSANVWVTLIGVLGFGVIIPVVLLGVDANSWLLGIVVAVGQFLAFIFTKSTRRTNVERKGKVINLTYCVFVLLPILSALGYVRLHGLFPSFTFSFLTVMAFVWVALYLYALGVYFIDGLSAILFGSKGGLMTVEVDGHLHLIVARSSAYHWIMLPCEYVEYKHEVKRKTGSSTVTLSNYLVFERGKFIIRDLTEFAGYIMQVEEGHSISRIKYDSLPK